jgi:hypothetical protein
MRRRRTRALSIWDCVPHTKFRASFAKLPPAVYVDDKGDKLLMTYTGSQTVKTALNMAEATFGGVLIFANIRLLYFSLQAGAGCHGECSSQARNACAGNGGLM